MVGAVGGVGDVGNVGGDGVSAAIVVGCVVAVGDIVGDVDGDG